MNRLKELMEYYGIDQTDIVKNTGIPKSSLSMMVNGKRELRHDKAKIIANAYCVNPVWLMGFDVPMRQNDYENTGSMFADIAMNPELLEVVSKLTKLKDSDKDIVVNLINSLYEKEN